MDLSDRPLLVGGSGFVGSALLRELQQRGGSALVVDRRPPPSGAFLPCDLLLDDVDLPTGPVVLLLGPSRACPARSWELAVPAVATARLLPALTGRRVTLLSSAEASGGPATGGLPGGAPPSDLRRQRCADAQVAVLDVTPAGGHTSAAQQDRGPDQRVQGESCGTSRPVSRVLSQPGGW